MRILALLIVCLVVAGCATTSQTDLSRKDLTMFHKSFEGTLVNKQIEEVVKEVPSTWIPFWKKLDTSIYFHFTVQAPDGTTRKFYDFTDDKNRMKVLYQYNRDLQQGDTVVVGLGLVDDKSAEEHFDIISRRL